MKIIKLMVLILFIVTNIVYAQNSRRRNRPNYIFKDGKLQRLYYDVYGKPRTLRQLGKLYGQPKDQLKGFGITLKSRVKIFMEKDPDSETDEKKEVKKIWLSGCRKYIELDPTAHPSHNSAFKGKPEDQKFYKNVKSGNLVYYKVTLDDKCSLGGWDTAKW